MKAAFTHPQFRTLYGGLAATIFGDSILLIVLSIWVKDLTGSSAAAGFTFFWLALPTLFAPVLGWVVDIFPRRAFLFWGNLASTLPVAMLLLVRDAEHVWIIYAAAFAYGISFVMMPAALNGMLKLVLPTNELVDGNAALGTTKEAMRIGGPLLGAGLYAAVGPQYVVAVNIATYLIAAIIVRTIRIDRDLVEPSDLKPTDALLVGVRHVRADPMLLRPLIAVGSAVIVFGFTESAVYALIDAFHKPAAFVGVIITMQSVGAVIGGVCASRLIRRTSEARAITIGLAMFAASMLGIALAPSMTVVLCVVVPAGFGLPVVIIALMTLMQVRTPAPIIGRVSAAFDVILGMPQTLSIAIGALLVTVIDYRFIFTILAVVCTIASAYMWLATASSRSTTVQ